MGEITLGTASAILLAPLVFLLPGGALLALLFPAESSPGSYRADTASWLILAASLTVALTPVAFLALHLCRLPVGLAAVLGVLAVSLGLIGWRRGPLWWAWLRERLAAPRHLWLKLLDAPLAALILVTVLVTGTRVWAVRGVNYGAWGDSYHHTMIVQLILDRAGLFTSWAPYAPLETFTYHFGFHTNVAYFQWATAWLSGNATPRTVVLVGQLLNVLAVLSLYPLAVRLSGGRRWVGVSAVLVGGLLMSMPAFYVNWGRYTQLTAQVILPAVLWFLVEAAEHPRLSIRHWALAGLALGGLGLTHYRVTFFVPCFLLPYLAWRFWLLRGDRRRAASLLAGLSIAAVVSLAIVTPWLMNLFNGRLPDVAADVVTDPNAGDNLRQVFLYKDPSQWVAWPLMVTAGLATVLALVRRSPVLLVTGWLVMLLLLANPHWLGLPGTGLVDNFTVLIALYMPVSLLTGHLLGQGLDFAQHRWRPTGLITIPLVIGLGALGVRARASALQPQFQMVTIADAEALRWIQANTGVDARFLVNSFFAYSDAYLVGSDAGWWIPLLTGRRNTVPPLLYASEMAADPDYIERVNSLARYVEDADLADQAMVKWLSEQGISHVYVGAQRGRVNEPDSPLLDTEVLQSSPYYRMVYSQNGVWIFELSLTPDEPNLSPGFILPDSTEAGADLPALAARSA
ncbi:MAG: glycosyltransferase family 39 protein [Anaerolineae bacterium]|nr:glycosyltransferase family 39 protein [Anaerolineae bacterium]